MKWFREWLRRRREERERARRLEALARDEAINLRTGRAFGWWVERDGQVICSLDDPQYADMFWTSYRVTPENGTPPELLREHSLWFKEHLRYRNRKLDRYAPNAFASIGREEGRICLRGDYFIEEE